MSLIDRISKRTTNLFNYAGSHKLYVAGAATALPVFFISAGSQLSSHSRNNFNNNQSGFTSDNSAPLQENNTNDQSIPDSSGQSQTDPDTTVDADNSSHTEATASIDGQSITASSDDNSDQSIHKTLNTGNGTASISIEQHSDSSTDGQSHSSSNVNVNSQATDSGSSSTNISQHSSGGISR
jgi:hypothetical protein